MPDLTVEKVDSASYSKFLGENPPEDPYSLPSLLDAYRAAFSREIEYLLIFKKETPIASCALSVGKKFSQPLVKLLPIRAYDGVHFRALEESKGQKQEYDRLMALQALEEFLSRSFSFYQLLFPPGVMDVRPFQWAGATVIPQYTYIMDLEKFSEESYTKSLREVLRAAERAGLKFGTCSVNELVSLHQLSYERHGRRPPVTQDNLRGLLGRLEGAGLLSTACVRNGDGKIVAGMTSLKSADGSYFFVAGTDAKAEKGASHLLYHEILKSEKEAGRGFVDFVGANTPTINLFKSSFGPRLEIYFRVWRANSLAARLASVVKKF